MESADHSNQTFSAAGAVVEPATPIFTSEASEKHERLFRRGVKLVGAGAGMLVLSFGINFMLVQSNPSFIPLMYGMTTIGATCMMKGLVDILG
jgi:hypothetical protein